MSKFIQLHMYIHQPFGQSWVKILYKRLKSLEINLAFCIAFHSNSFSIIHYPLSYYEATLYLTVGTDRKWKNSLSKSTTAFLVGISTHSLPWLITSPKYVQPACSILCFIGSMLFAFSNGGEGLNYWKFMFSGLVLGSLGGMTIFIGMNTSIIQAFPVEYAGIGGSVANIIFQIGGVFGISVQAGLINTGDGTLEDWTGSKKCYFFTGAYILFTGLVFVIWYKPYKQPKNDVPIA